MCEVMSISDIASWLIHDGKIHSWDNKVDVSSYHILYIIFTSWYLADDDIIGRIKDNMESFKYPPNAEEKLILLYKGVEYLTEPICCDSINDYMNFDDDDLFYYMMDTLEENNSLNDFMNIYIQENIFSYDEAESDNYNYVINECVLPDEEVITEVVRFLDMVDHIEDGYGHDLSDEIII